jgi:hypothetical protein
MRIKDEAPHQNPTSTDRYESREEQVESDGNFYDDDSESIFFRAVSLGVALSRDSYDTFNAQTEAELKENYHAQSNTVVDDNARMELGEGATSVQDGHETFWGRRFAEKREASRRDIKRLGLRSRATTLWLDRYELEESHRVSKMKLHVALIPCHGVAKERS